MSEERIGVCYDNRFIMVNYEAVMNGGLKAHEIAVYVVLCAFASNGSRSCYPSFATLAEKAGCSRSTVIRTIAVLEERGLIEKINQIGEDGNHKSNLYMIKTNVVQGAKNSNVAKDSGTQAVVSEKNHPGVSEIPAAVSDHEVVSQSNQLDSPSVPTVVLERNGGSVRESHELYIFNYNIKPEEDEEEERLKQKIEYNYFLEEMPDRIGVVDTLVDTILALNRENKQNQLRLLDKVDSCVILDFMDEFKGKSIGHVHNYSAWLKTVFLEFLRKQEAFRKDFW